MSQKPSFLQVIFSAIAAAFGVQSDKNRQRDFENGRITHYIAAGLLVTVMFIVLVYLGVNFALNNATT